MPHAIQQRGSSFLRSRYPTAWAFLSCYHHYTNKDLYVTFLLSAAVSTICRVSAPCHPTGREQFCFARPSVGVLWIQRDVHAKQTLGSRASKAPSCLGDIETFCRGVVSGERSANALFVQLSPLFVSAARPPRLFWAAFCSDSPGFCYFSVWARCAQSDFLRLLIIRYGGIMWVKHDWKACLFISRFSSFLLLCGHFGFEQLCWLVSCSVWEIKQ